MVRRSCALNHVKGLMYPRHLVSAATFTVFDVANGGPTASIVSVRPLGVGSDGTTYEVAVAQPTGGSTVTGTSLDIVLNSSA